MTGTDEQQRQTEQHDNVVKVPRSMIRKDDFGHTAVLGEREVPLVGELPGGDQPVEVKLIGGDDKGGFGLNDPF